MSSRQIVSVTRVATTIEAAVRTALDRVGGLGALVGRGDDVFLKPNFVAPRPSSRGVTTDLEIIRVVSEEVRRCGAKPALYETPATEFDQDAVFKALGVYDFCRKNGIRLLTGPQEEVRLAVPGAAAFKHIRIPKVLHGAKIINLPKLKTHVCATMTCAVKNLIGLLPDSEKRRVHILGVHRTVADLARVFRPVLTVVDALTCMEGDGPTYGDPVELGLIIAGRDMLAVDRACARLIGLQEGDVEYLRLAAGETSRSDIDLVGDAPLRPPVPFRIPRKSIAYTLGFGAISAVDVVFSRVFSRSIGRVLYGTGRFGTNPHIVRQACDRCGECLATCPVGEVLDLENFRIRHQACLRCLNCYLACRRGAITVKGVSRPRP